MDEVKDIPLPTKIRPDVEIVPPVERPSLTPAQAADEYLTESSNTGKIKQSQPEFFKQKNRFLARRKANLPPEVQSELKALFGEDDPRPVPDNNLEAEALAVIQITQHIMEAKDQDFTKSKQLIEVYEKMLESFPQEVMTRAMEIINENSRSEKPREDKLGEPHDLGAESDEALALDMLRAYRDLESFTDTDTDTDTASPHYQEKLAFFERRKANASPEVLKIFKAKLANGSSDTDLTDDPTA